MEQKVTNYAQHKFIKDIHKDIIELVNHHQHFPFSFYHPQKNIFKSLKRNPIQIYQDEIINYLKKQQPKYRINPNFINSQFMAKTRTLMIKNMIKTAWQFQCKRKTTYLAIYCFDYYLSKNKVTNDRLLILVSKAALHLAMKFEQIYPVSLKQWTRESQQNEIINLQGKILTTMNFNLNYPSIAYFQQYFNQKYKQIIQLVNNYSSDNTICQCDDDLLVVQQSDQIQMIGDMCLFDYKFYKYSPLELSECIFKMVYEMRVTAREREIILLIQNSINRNPQLVYWLKKRIYS